MPMYNFDPAEEQDDLLEQELLDHGREGSLTGPNAKVGQKVSGTLTWTIYLPWSVNKSQVVNGWTTKAMIAIFYSAHS